MTDELTWVPAWRIRDMIASKIVSPVEVLAHFLGRIEELQPELRALEHIDRERAGLQAQAAEAAVLAGEELGALHGIPTAVKSHLDIEGVPETMPFGNGIAPSDDLTVERLRHAGAVIVGHTVMPVSDKSGHFDHAACARNPWDTTRTPGISSAGSAAAVAAGLLPLALASDGGASSRVPASYSGVIGVHSTPGLVPWVNGKRQTPMGATSTIGPMARDARDAATMLSVIAGPDGRDEVGLHVPLPDPRSELDLGANGMKLAWTDDFGFTRTYAVEESERVITHVRNAAFAMRDIGATIDSTNEQWEDHIPALRMKFAAEGIGSMGLEGAGLSTEDPWQESMGVRHRNWLRFQRLFNDVDLLLSPTIHSVAPTVEVFATWIPTGQSIVELGPGPDHYTSYCGMLNWLKLPAVSVPCGFVDGLPVGLQIIGPSGSDATLLRLALAFLAAFPRDEHPSLTRPSSSS